MPAQSQSSKSATAAAAASSSGTTSSGVDALNSNSRAARQGASTSSSSSIGLTHHPYRIEVQQVSPVSISLRWSLRPPPISQLRNSKRTRREVNGDGADATEKTKDAAEGQGAGEGAAENDDEDGDDDEDDDATAVDGSASERDEDFADSRPGAAAAPPSSNRAAAANPYRMTKIFEEGVSVTVNGAVWSQVVMADQGYDEAVIVIYGLEPNRAYDVEMSVGGPDSKRNVILSTSAATASVPEEATAQVEAGGAPSAPCSEHGHASGSATPTASGSTSALAATATADRSSPSLASGAQQELLAAQELRNSLNAELRQARRDASRAEQALRNEIEAIKRSLERMSSVDHRSKQKVLALQESIRQANQSAKDIAEEAEQTEKEHPKGEERARKLGEEEAKKRGEVEDIEAGNDAQVKREEETTAAAEKELAGLQKALASRQGDVEKLQSGRIAELERDVARLQAESDRINNSATPPPPAPPATQQLDARGGRGPFDPQAGGSSVPASGSGAYRSVSAPRGRGQSGRGGASGGGKQRNASGPHSFHHRRGGRGGGAASSAGGNVAPPPFGLDHGAYLASGFANPNTNTSAAIGTTPSPSGLNPASSDFIPSSSSTHASPIIAKNAGGSGMAPPGIGGVGLSVIGRGSGGGLSSGPNSASHGSHHESPTAVHPQFGPGNANSFAPRLDSPTSASPFAAGPIGPSYHHHHPAYHQHHPHNTHLSALANANASSVFDSTSRRRPSGPLDFDDDAAFDPTRAGSISPSFGAAPGSGSSRFMPAASTSTTSAASPWSTTAPGASLTAASVGSPWAKASSPLLGTGSGLPSSATAGTAGAGVGGPGSDEIWGVNVSPSASTLPAASLRPQAGALSAGGGGAFHPLYPQQPPHPPPSSIFAHSHSPFGHPHRSASGSSASASASASTHNSGSAGTPTSPTAPTGLPGPGSGMGQQQRLGSGSGTGGGGFGAIGGGAAGGGGGSGGGGGGAE